jgi:hypothetical protein
VDDFADEEADNDGLNDASEGETGRHCISDGLPKYVNSDSVGEGTPDKTCAFLVVSGVSSHSKR